MDINVAVLRSQVVSPALLQANAAQWHVRARDGVSVSLVDSDEDTVLIKVYCERPQPVYCMERVGIFDPGVVIEHVCGDAQADKALGLAEPFVMWCSSADVSAQATRCAVILKSRNGTTAGGTNVSIEWSRLKPGRGRFLAFGLGRDSPLSQDLTKRAAWFEEALRAIGLQEKVAVQVIGGKLAFATKAPWNVETREHDATREANPLEIMVFPFDSMTSIYEAAKRLARIMVGEVTSCVLIAELPMDAYNSSLNSVPGDFEGWSVEVFGHPSDTVLAWLQGKVKKRPPGQIPLGHGWEGSESRGFAYSVSVVETPSGPCIELASDSASAERLGACSRYFRDMDFHTA